jgi:hypothetical protein
VRVPKPCEIALEEDPAGVAFALSSAAVAAIATVRIEGNFVTPPRAGTSESGRRNSSVLLPRRQVCLWQPAVSPSVKPIANLKKVKSASCAATQGSGKGSFRKAVDFNRHCVSYLVALVDEYTGIIFILNAELLHDHYQNSSVTGIAAIKEACMQFASSVSQTQSSPAKNMDATCLDVWRFIISRRIGPLSTLCNNILQQYPK